MGCRHGEKDGLYLHYFLLTAVDLSLSRGSPDRFGGSALFLALLQEFGSQGASCLSGWLGEAAALGLAFFTLPFVAVDHLGCSQEPP